MSSFLLCWDLFSLSAFLVPSLPSWLLSIKGFLVSKRFSLPHSSAVVYLAGWWASVKSSDCVCVDIWTCFVCLSHAYTWGLFFFPDVNMPLNKDRLPSLFQDHQIMAVWSSPAVLSQTTLTSLCSSPARWKTRLSLFSLAFPFQDTVFMTAVNAQKPPFVTERVHFDLDSQLGLSSGPVGACSVHFTQLPLNPVRGIGFGRSGISLGFTIWNHISFSFSESLGE